MAIPKPTRENKIRYKDEYEIQQMFENLLEHIVDLSIRVHNVDPEFFVMLCPCDHEKLKKYSKKQTGLWKIMSDVEDAMKRFEKCAFVL